MYILGTLNCGVSPQWPVFGAFASRTSSSHLRNWSSFQLCLQTGLGTASCLETSSRRPLFFCLHALFAYNLQIHFSFSVSMHRLHIISKYVFLAPTILLLSVRLFNYGLNLVSLLVSQPKHVHCQSNLFFSFFFCTS